MTKQKKEKIQKKNWRNSKNGAIIGGNTARENAKYMVHNQKSIAKINRMNCAPNVDNKTVNKNTCFTPDIMIQLKATYNNQFPEHHITSENPNEIWNIMHEELSNKPNSICGKKREDCWLDTLIKDKKMRKKIEELIFRPEQPDEWAKNPDEWLSNYDIFEVAKQYEEVDPAFKMIAPTPIDYNTKPQNESGKCVSEELCNFDLKKWMNMGKYKFGIVFNLDKHTEPGSHWVSVWIDVHNQNIVYFDSAANKLPKEIKNFIEMVELQGKTLHPSIDFKIYQNGSHAHQKSNTECGMYSLFFIITMLTGKIPIKNKNKQIHEEEYHMKSLDMKERIDLFIKGKISDEMVFDYRDLYFNPQ